MWVINNPFYFKVAIDNLEFGCMDPDMEHHYEDLLHQWKHDEDNIKDELKEDSEYIETFKEVATNTSSK